MKRFLFNLVTLLSLVAGVALLLALARSPWGFSNGSPVRAVIGSHAWFLTSRAGSVRIVCQFIEGTGAAGEVADPGHLGAWHVLNAAGSITYASRFGPEDTRHGALGFAWDDQQYVHRGFTAHYHEWAVPYWFLLAVAATAPALWLRAWARLKRREVTGLCPKCGYDLRAEEDADGALVARCPECGAEEGSA